MYTNADITLYSYKKAGYSRSEIKGVFWSDSKQANVIKSGMTTADAVKILIPLENINENLVFSIGKDLIVKGLCDYEIDNTSEKSISESIRTLSKEKLVTVSTVDEKLYGSKHIQHYKLGCK